MKKILLVGMMEILLIALMVFIAIYSQAQNVPKTLSFQGYLADKNTGDPLTQSVDMKFSLFDALSGGNEVWFDDYTSVQVTKGLYSIMLGDKKSIDLPFDKVYYLQVKVGTEVLDPRITLTSSAYSLSSINAANITSGTIDNLRLDPNLQDLADGTLTGSKIGTGISASNITTGSLSLSLLPDDLITTAKIANDQVTLAKIGTTGAADGNKIFSTDAGGNPVFITSIPVANGGTGSTTAANARTNLGAAAAGTNSDITALNALSTAITVTQGGTGSTTAANARTNLGAAAAGSNSDITALNSLSTAITVTQGGTGSTTAANARTNLGAAAAGSNSDITALNSLSTAITITQGGTGASNASTARTNLGLVIGTNVQAYDADLDDLAVDGSIDGSKVVPAFGSQNITTAGYATLTNGLKVGSASVPTTGNLEVDNYTKLGSGSPAVKMLVLSGVSYVTAGSQGGSKTYAHGVDGTKIVEVNVFVEFIANNFIPDRYSYNAGYEFTFYFDQTNITIGNVTGNSANILNKNVKIVITYQQ